MHKIIARLKIERAMLKARLAVALGFCPLCYSETPELDECLLCAGYDTANGDTFPPPKHLKARWLSIYRHLLTPLYRIDTRRL